MFGARKPNDALLLFLARTSGTPSSLALIREHLRSVSGERVT